MKITRKPNPQLRKIVLEETNDGRDVVRYLKSVIVDIEGAPELYGLRHKDYARSHKIAAARILARLGLEEGKRYLDRTYVQTPFRRVHPEEEDGPKRDMAASTAQLYRLVKKETNDGADIIIRFVGIMKGYHPEYKPHLRMAAAKELIRQIEFDYDYDEPTSPTTSTHTESTHESIEEDSQIKAHHTNHTDHSSDHARTASTPDADLPHQPNPVHPINPAHPDSDKDPNPASDKITAHHTNHTNHSSDKAPSLADIQRRMHVEDGSVHYRDYAAQHAKEGESIYQSIIRRASDSYNLNGAQIKVQDLIAEFDDFMAERDPEYRPIAVPDNLITTSLTQRMDETRTYPFDPADYYDLDQDYFYYCMCLTCEACDELHYFFKFMRELEDETNHLLEDP